jgi:hypothetical protein
MYPLTVMPAPSFIRQGNMVLASALGATGAMNCHVNLVNHVHAAA